MTEEEIQGIVESLKLRFNAMSVDCIRGIPRFEGYHRYDVRIYMEPGSFYETWADIDPQLPAYELENIFAEAIQRAVVTKKINEGRLVDQNNDQ